MFLHDLHAWLECLRRPELVRFDRLRRMPRYRATTVSILGRPFAVADGPSAYSAYRSIFLDEDYAFAPGGERPRIIDVGANVGLSVLYFKTRHPGSRVVAFEPDPGVFAVLERNVAGYALADVELFNCAVWKSAGQVSFDVEGADGGRVLADGEASQHRIDVPTVRLRPWLEQPVDLLKIDIEGAETDVIEDCSDLLPNVRHLFVEYHSFADRPQSLGRLLQTINEAGFRVRIGLGSSPPRRPLMPQPPGGAMDMQLNIFAVRELPPA